MARQHRYAVTVAWSGDRGTGTSAYHAYGRDHEITAPSKTSIPGSSDPAFRGDAARWNPEELLVASLSACHQLWYLHLCSEHGIIVTAYVDHAEGFMEESAEGGHFTKVVLHPEVKIVDATRDLDARALHRRAHECCFIANSIRFPVEVDLGRGGEMFDREDDGEPDQDDSRGALGDVAIAHPQAAAKT